MIGKELLKTIIADNQSRVLPELWKRTLEIPLHSDKIVALVGVRRSGKTYHLFNLINQLKAEGIPNSQILYINFEDERLQFSSENIGLILEAYQELYPQQKLSDCYFFFDEIQEVEGWEKFIARLYATASKHVYITGSNAKFLSREIATSLRGRPITYEVYPLSFKEFANILAPNVSIHSTSDKAKLAHLFEQFLFQGGFPELVKQNEELREKILQEYFNVMLLRDIIERFNITQSAILKYFCKRVIGNTAGEFSVNKIYNELKSQGYQVGKDTLYAYQSYVEAIYLTYLLPKYAHSVVKSEMAQKKSYVIDQGLGVALDYKLNQDKGRLLETTIALELLKKNKQIAYQKNGTECDFVIMEKGHITNAIQVTVSLDDEQVRAREITGLIEACKKLNLQEGIILTLDKQEEILLDGVTIHIIPAWLYCLSGEI